jgi:hypothetical protein
MNMAWFSAVPTLRRHGSTDQMDSERKPDRPESKGQDEGQLFAGSL